MVRPSPRVRFLGPLLAATVLVPLVPAVAQAPQAAAANLATASGFLVNKYPTPQPLCDGLAQRVAGAPWFSRDDCGRVDFTLAGAADATTIEAELTVEGADTPYVTLPVQTTGGTSYDVAPDDTWPAGRTTATIVVDGVAVGSHDLLVNALGATVTAGTPGVTARPGEDLPVTGEIGQLDVLAAQPSRTGVAAIFDVLVTLPDGSSVVAVDDAVAASDGTFAVVVPGGVTADVTADERTDFEVGIGISIVDARYEDPRTGEWAAGTAGTTGATLVAVPDTGPFVTLLAKYASATGWVKPGDTFPLRVTASNLGTSAATGTIATLRPPPSVTFTDVTTLNGSGTATIGLDGTITWTLGVLAPPAGAPGVATLVVEARADDTTTDPRIAWKDLSVLATISHAGGDDVTSVTHGPKVIPADESFETARYGDKPFPMVPVEYRDRSRAAASTTDALFTAVNDPDFVGSTFNLYQEMSYGQLFPEGTIPSQGIASAGFDGYVPPFTEPALEKGTCRGVTIAGAGPLSAAAYGSPLYPERIVDGWYQLPGDTEYYGGDYPAFTLGVGSTIDSACGQLGKGVYDAAAIADPDIDYNDYDSDKDGVVDFFMLVFNGCGGNGASQVPLLCPLDDLPYDNIWPHSSSLEMQYRDDETGLRGFISDDQLRSQTEVPQCWLTEARITFDDCATDGGAGLDTLPVFVRVGPYNVNPETAIASASVISHEYGHHLGLPDFYTSGDTYYASTNLMSSDEGQHMTIFGKQELGWVVPQVLQPGDDVTVTDWEEIKTDIGEIQWVTPDGDPYTLSAANGDQNIHNGRAWTAKLPTDKVIDTALVEAGGSLPNVYWSGRGNAFGCSPTGAHNLDLKLPDLSDVPPGADIELTFQTLFDIEWDWDYGFVLATTDGASYTSLPSEMGYTTESTYNPNASACLDELDNGLTGTTKAWADGTAAATVARNPVEPDYSGPSPFIPDAYDLSDFAGEENAVVRFSYHTDAAFDRPGWFIDDVVVTVDGDEIYASGFDDDDEEGRLHNGGCDPDLPPVAANCTAGWNRIDASTGSTRDVAYYLELRDRALFDFEGYGQSDRAGMTWDPGLFIEYTEETRGIGNNGVPSPPAQHYLDVKPIPGDDFNPANEKDAALQAGADRNHFDDVDHVDNFSDPSTDSGDWEFFHECLTVDVTAMSGQDTVQLAPDLTANVELAAGDGCAVYDYGFDEVVEGPDGPVGPVNTAPVAKFTFRPTSPAPGEQVIFDGSRSTDDATGLTYSWDLDDDGTFGDETGEVITHTFADPGTYPVTLQVTDAGDLKATFTDDVVVTAANAAPVARIVGPTEADEGVAVTFDGTTSSDANDDPLTYDWDFGDGSTSTAPRPSHAFADAGTYTVALTVDDGEASDTATQQVTVTGNRPPTVDAGDDRSGTVGSPVAFEATGSDPDGDDLTFRWDFGDGTPTRSGATASHTYDAPGTYTATVTATDARGATATDAVEVEVATEPDPDPSDPDPTDPEPTDPDPTDPDPTDPDPDPTDPDPTPTETDEPKTVDRVSGSDRVATSTALSREVFTDATVAVLARSDAFPDALAGSTLAAEVDAPLLLSLRTALPAAVRTELERLGVTKVYLLGGEAALGPEVAAALTDYEVERLAGDDRFATAAAIAAEVVELGGRVDRVVVALGQHATRDAWPDALSTATYAARGRAPVLLTRAEVIPQVTLDAITRSLAVTADAVTIVGGRAVIPQARQDELAVDHTVTRLAGDDRYGTSVAIVEAAQAFRSGRTPVLLGSGAAFPDALGAGPAAAHVRGVLLLVHPTDLDRSIATRDWLTTHGPEIDVLHVIGGPNAISQDVMDAAEAAITAE